MKQKILVFITVFLLGIPAFAQTTEIEVFEKTTETDPITRSPSIIPITCYYYPSMETVELIFAENLGNVEITVSYLDSGEVENYQHTGTGPTIIPLQGSGLILIEMITQSGKRYWTFFYTN